MFFVHHSLSMIKNLSTTGLTLRCARFDIGFGNLDIDGFDIFMTV